MRIAAGGIAHESCTFSPDPTTRDDFSVLRGESLLARYDFLAEYQDVTVVPLFQAWARAGGSVVRKDYEEFKTEFLDLLAQGAPYDGVYLDMHGAMHVEGMDDAELDWVTAVREVVGPNCSISASNDLHGNLSRQATAVYDAVTAYRTAPHTDTALTRSRAFDLLVQMIRSGKLLHRAHVGVPLTLPGERAMTTVEPGQSAYAKIDEVTQRAGVVDASILVGYVWADEPRNHASVVVLGSDAEAVNSGARDLATTLWSLRHDLQFGMPTGTVDECIVAAKESSRRPFFISDAGDNLTGGGVGDIPHCLERLIEHNADGALVAAIADDRGVDQCFRAGKGAPVSMNVGGTLDHAHGSPLLVNGIVDSLHEHAPANRMAIVSVGGVRVILTEHRFAFTELSEFTDLGIDVAQEEIVIVKLGYLFPELAEIAAASYLAFSPGAINPHVESLTYNRISRPMFPFDPNMEWQPPEDCLLQRPTV